MKNQIDITQSSDTVKKYKLTPLDYMLEVINDENASETRRDRMAHAAAPYCHAKIGEKGKKESDNDKAKDTFGGKFKPRPLKAVNE